MMNFPFDKRSHDQSNPIMKASLTILAALLLAPHAGLSAAEPVSKPNIIFILIDDLGYMDIGANNPQTFYETPNIDALAAKGMRFKQGYAACPVCSPTRASILTGKYPPRTGITDYIGGKRAGKLLPAPNRDRLALEETTLAEAFKAGGYATFFAGKWHLGPENFWPENQGFDFNLGGTDAGGPYKGKKYFSPYENPRLPDGPPGEYLPDRLASETVKFIAAHRDQPFLAYLSFYSVHTPLMAPDDLRKKYEAKAKSLPTDGPVFGKEHNSEVRMVQDHAVYAGMVEAMDQAIGKVMAALESEGLVDRTIVVFTSDNGGLSTSEGHPTSNLPLRGGKGWLYEGGIREPMIIRAPGVTKAGSICETPVTSPDFYPTLLELAGLPMPPKQPVDGMSLVTLLKGEPLARGPIFWHYPHYGNQGGAPGGAVRDGDWKLIEWYEGSVELYNIAQDIGEKNNLAAQYPDKVKALQEMLTAWRKEVNAVMPTPNPNFDPTAKPADKPGKKAKRP